MIRQLLRIEEMLWFPGINLKDLPDHRTEEFLKSLSGDFNGAIALERRLTTLLGVIANCEVETIPAR